MGYYTNYKITVFEGNREVTEFDYPNFSELELYGGSISIQDLVDDTADSCKWYDHEEEMIIYSKKFPDLLFVLDGDGEESGDIWRKFAVFGNFVLPWNGSAAPAFS